MNTKKTILLIVVALQFICIPVLAQLDVNEDLYAWRWAKLSDLVDRKNNKVNTRTLIGIIGLKQNKSSNQPSSLLSNMLIRRNVYFSEKPNGEKSGVYFINTSKLTMTFGDKKNIIKSDDMREMSGWRLFGFGKNKCLYLSDVDDDAILENVLVYEAYALKEDIEKQAQQKLIDIFEPKSKEDEIREHLSEKDISTPEKEGYTLLDTKTVAGFQCDIYLEGVRTFRSGNGDFVTFTERKGYENRGPFRSDRSMGDWQLTSENGFVVKQQSGIVRVEFPSGCSIVNRKGYRLWWNTDYNRPLIHTAWINGDLLYLPGIKEPLRYVKSKEDHRMVEEGYLLGNRLYAVTDEGTCYPYKQIVNGIAYSALASDSIVSADFEEGEKLELKYANGDYLKFGEIFDVIEGTIHRNGGVLTIKPINGKIVKVLTFPNGDKFAGEFKYDNFNPMTHSRGVGDFLKLETLSEPELTPWTGTLIKKDGTRIQYEKGKTEQQILVEKQAAQAKTNAQYQELCKQFGKKYVDAALVQRPIVGMPETLLKAAFTLELVQQGTYSTLYRITGWGWKNFGKTLSDHAYLYSVWVTNGKVSDIRYWTNAQ